MIDKLVRSLWDHPWRDIEEACVHYEVKVTYDAFNTMLRLRKWMDLKRKEKRQCSA